MRTTDQKLAHEAYSRVVTRKTQPDFDFGKYSSVALSFPALIHSCGLTQALAYAEAKGYDNYIDDLQSVFSVVDVDDDLDRLSRNAELDVYTRISRHALTASSWIKRYCQAMNSGGENFA